MTLSLAKSRPRRKPSLTPMIDVVFLLLVFFMLASRFGVDQVLPLPLASGGSGYSGPPRLVNIQPDALQLNGREVSVQLLIAALKDMTKRPDDLIILRGGDETDLQRLVTIAAQLRSAGFSRLTLVE
ncbi:ExbD/TolR family protein [Heliomarina baculiformis]|uniref:ExbD/TolR family protein n=1 Tax=Heliomarina baculiformis TaxID=2872036 RepID=UPI001EE16AE5|nr:biopolymer transporter ExbD [Heliomarina baculiformis]